MTDRSKEILDLINSNGKNASAMTSALKKNRRWRYAKRFRYLSKLF